MHEQLQTQRSHQIASQQYPDAPPMSPRCHTLFNVMLDIEEQIRGTWFQQRASTSSEYAIHFHSRLQQSQLAISTLNQIFAAHCTIPEQDPGPREERDQQRRKRPASGDLPHESRRRRISNA